VLAEDAFGLGLGQEQQEWVGGVIQAQIEHRHCQSPAGDVHAQLHSPVSAGDQLVGDTETRQNLQGARLDGQRAGLVHPVQATVDEAGPDTEGGQLRSEGQPSRPGADHEHVDQPACHDATLRFATGAGAAACPPTPSARRCAARRRQADRQQLIEGRRPAAAHPPAHMLQFPSLEQARAWWESQQYRPLVKLRQPPCFRRLRVPVDGIGLRNQK
jgi:Domain of unknown function (DUF1330)